MPDSTIPNLTENTNPALAAYIPIADGGANYKITINNLFKSLHTFSQLGTNTNVSSLDSFGNTYTQNKVFSGNVYFSGLGTAAHVFRVDAGTAYLKKIVAGDFSTHVQSGAFGAILAGSGQKISGVASVSLGGQDNVISSQNGEVSFNLIYGMGNRIANANYSSVVGGSQNRLGRSGISVTDVSYAFIGGGLRNIVSGTNSVVVGGEDNIAEDTYCFIGGGSLNNTYGQRSVVVGGTANMASGSRSFIGGGDTNTALSSFSLVCGGFQNFVGRNSDYSVVVGGNFNSLTGLYSFIGGGNLNRASGDYSAIVGGSTNKVFGRLSFVGAGFRNQIRENTESPQNIAGNSVILGGYDNASFGNATFIGAGELNIVSGEYSFVGAGNLNFASGAFSAIVAGTSNKTYQNNCFVGGGQGNAAGTVDGATDTVVVGGLGNTANGSSSFIGGGSANRVTGGYGVVVGGFQNFATGIASFIGGGWRNNATGKYSAVLGGHSNSASGDYAAVLGGLSNRSNALLAFTLGSGAGASGIGSIAFGHRSVAFAPFSQIYGHCATVPTLHSGAMILADHSGKAPARQSYSASSLTLHFGSGVVFSGTKIIVDFRSMSAPSNGSAPGILGEVRFTPTAIYICGLSDDETTLQWRSVGLA